VASTREKETIESGAGTVTQRIHIPSSLSSTIYEAHAIGMHAAGARSTSGRRAIHRWRGRASIQELSTRRSKVLTVRWEGRCTIRRERWTWAVHTVESTHDWRW